MALTKVINDLIDLNATDATKSLKMPSGAAYSGTAQDGMIRNDTDGDSQGSASTMQHFNGTDWKNYENLSNIAPLVVEFLVVAGGASGGTLYGGGGGAGGLRTSFTNTSTLNGHNETALSLSVATNYTVTVGPGGAGVVAYASSNAGYISTFSGSFTGSPITSSGGGGGGKWNNTSASTPGSSGGSGGGGPIGQNVFDATPGGSAVTNPVTQGYAGGSGYHGNSGAYACGGGGGADSVGVPGGAGSFTGGNGGDGLEVNIIGGTGNFYAGGGGGLGQTTAGTGGSSIGGNAGTGAAGNNGSPGSLNTGSGGGGSNGTSGAGGTGIIILRYPDGYTAAVTGSGTGVLNGNVTGSTDKYTTITSGTGTVTFS